MVSKREPRARAGPRQTGRSPSSTTLNCGARSDADEIRRRSPPRRRRAAAPAGRRRRGASSRRRGDSIRAMMLIRTYRVRGHLAADLDPLGLSKHELPADLTPEYHGFSGADLDRPVYLGGTLGLQWATMRELVDDPARELLRQCRPRIHAHRRRRGAPLPAGADGGQGQGDQLHARGQEGDPRQGDRRPSSGRNSSAANMSAPSASGSTAARAMIPALEAVIKYGGQFGVREIVFGMAHRGRLNVLANVMAKPYRVIFHEFSGGSANPEDVGGSGDVKYHLGTSHRPRVRRDQGAHVAWSPTPSHLEAVDPVVLGKVRATQAIRDDLDEHKEVLPVLIHGDAAFAGQGIVWECFGFSGHPRLQHRRLHPLHHQQPDRLHHQPAIRPLLALSVGRRQGRPGADPPRQRRRSRGGDLRLQAGDRVPPDASSATSSSTCGATAASATTRATSRASPSR